MKYFACIILAMGLLWPSFSLVAQQSAPSLSMDFQIRPRTEFRNGSFTLRPTDANPAFFTSSRNRLGLGFKEGPLSVRLAVQNVTVWGQSPQVQTGASTMLNEAWAKYAFNDFWNVQFGRQQIAYDDDRVLGTLEWHQSGRWHDALFFKYANEARKLDIGFAFNQNNERILGTEYLPSGQPYKSLQMLHYQNKPTDQIEYSLLFLNLGLQGGSPGDLKDEYLSTMGGNMAYKVQDWTFGGTFYYQTGAEANGQSVDAYMYSAYAKLKVNKITYTLGNDRLSGNDFGATGGSDGSFNPLYGTHHKFYGYMDYFYVGNSHGDVGINDIYAKMAWRKSPKLQLGLAVHRFASDGEINGNQAYLGTEIDFTFNYALAKDMNLQGGYSQMLADENMEIIKGGDAGQLQNWVWLMLKVSPSFIF